MYDWYIVVSLLVFLAIMTIQRKKDLNTVKFGLVLALEYTCAISCKGNVAEVRGAKV